MVAVIIVIFVLAFVGWPTYGYLKGKPHGLGAEGIKYSMTGVLGMKKLNAEIRNKRLAEQRRTSIKH